MWKKNGDATGQVSDHKALRNLRSLLHPEFPGTSQLDEESRARIQRAYEIVDLAAYAHEEGPQSTSGQRFTEEQAKAVETQAPHVQPIPEEHARDVAQQVRNVAQRRRARAQPEVSTWERTASTHAKKRTSRGSCPPQPQHVAHGTIPVGGARWVPAGLVAERGQQLRVVVSVPQPFMPVTFSALAYNQPFQSMGSAWSPDGRSFTVDIMAPMHGRVTFHFPQGGVMVDVFAMS